MKIQRFEGDSTREALAKVQQALGEDAVILQTRNIRTPGVLRRQRVEVLAAVDGAQGGTAPAPQNAPLIREERSSGSATSALTEHFEPPVTPAAASNPQVRPAGQPPLKRAALASDTTKAMEGWQEEFSQLRHELAQLRCQLSRSPLSPMPKFDLEAMGADDPETFLAELHRDLRTSSIQLKQGRPTVIGLIGPTGVGKTTTLAKLAAAASRQEHKRIAFITIDTYRIGALEQLEAYARLLEVPLTRVYAPEDIKGALERYASYDLIFVDSIGRSAFNTKQISEQIELLETLGTDEVHLCLDSGASPATLRRSLEGFSLLHPTHILLTKLDETASLRVTLEIVMESGIPLSYVTTGQRVPEDLALASPDDLAERILLGEE
ncbi:flagellar biosynthesis protein FlhF [Armatimonas sp.]|uniref:flagellar biosynthesis protein FlhF n=1 Tax=Armatimonas sp. TaxID=1872638 RepID=UPI00286A336C|nr:flagellar biosynthesis protein FlhF [Armatimonas sp.]